MSNENKILVIDIETTHINPKQGSIVEIGCSEVDTKTFDVKMVFDTVCREERLTAKHREEPYGWIFNNSTLTPEIVREAPSFENEVKPKLQDLINQYPLGCTAFNRNFDMGYLYDRGLFFPKLQACPMLELTPIMKLPHKNGRRGNKWPKVDEVWREYLDYPEYKELHRAGPDSFDEAGLISGMIQRGDYKIE